jgi:hypothetical protein
MTACVSTTFDNHERLSLSQINKINWTEINQDNAVKYFGKPDIKEHADSLKKEVAWVYLGGTPRTTRLALIFNANLGTLISANWFFRSTDKESTLESLEKNYPQLSFDLKSPIVRDDLRGPEILIYPSKNGGPLLAIYKRSNMFSSLSWELSSQARQEKRKPTSH